MAATVLERIVEERGESMIRRLAQVAVAGDRGISQADIAREVGVSQTQITLYFQGRGPSQRLNGTMPGGRDETDEEFAVRRDDFEDEVEQALERLSAATDFVPPRACRIVGPPDETGLPEVEWIDAFVPEAITLELMRP